MRTWTRQQRLLAATATAALIGGVTWLAWPSSDSTPPIRERQYKATTACLLTDDHGLESEPARTAWAGMQEASTQSLIKVQHLAITGPQDVANGLTYYNTLGIQRCTIILAAGDVPVAVMVEGSARFPDIQQVTIGGDPGNSSLTKLDVSTPDTLRGRVREIVTKAA